MFYHISSLLTAIKHAEEADSVLIRNQKKMVVSRRHGATNYPDAIELQTNNWLNINQSVRQMKVKRRCEPCHARTDN